MRRFVALLALSLAAAAPAAGQTGAPVATPSQAAPQAQSNPYQNLFTRWDGANRDSLEAEAGAPQPGPESDGNAIPASSPLVPASRTEAVALGERVGAVVRAGDCAEGERIAREAGDFALVRAVREHCGRRD
jgi:hypothetical protein